MPWKEPSGIEQLSFGLACQHTVPHFWVPRCISLAAQRDFGVKGWPWRDTGQICCPRAEGSALLAAPFPPTPFGWPGWWHICRALISLRGFINHNHTILCQPWVAEGKVLPPLCSSSPRSPALQAMAQPDPACSHCPGFVASSGAGLVLSSFSPLQQAAGLGGPEWQGQASLQNMQEGIRK